MDSASENEIRRARIAWMLDDLEVRLTEWQAHRKQSDCDENGQYIGRHRTQLQAVASLLAGSFEVLRSELESIEGDREVGEFFARSRRIADATVWLERVWSYFAERFDQRDGDSVRAMTVMAADEVVWSCYRPAYEHPRTKALELPAKPPPLSFVEPEFSPAARTLDSTLESQLQPSLAIDALAEVAGQMPMPLLRLPPWCVGAPWWLIFIGHEVGHHLQHEFELIGPFRRAVEAAAGAAGAEPEDAKRWGRWGEEIFADIVSILLVGPWALWALIEAERSPPRAMTRRRGRYAAALTRIRMMAGMLEIVGFEPRPYLRGLDFAPPADAFPSYAIDQKVAPQVIPLIDQSWPSFGKLSKLLRFNATDFSTGGVVDSWAGRLLSDAELAPSRQLETARHIVTGSLVAWARLGAERPADLQAQARSLAVRTQDALCASAPPGTRADTMPSGEDPELGKELAAGLLALSETRQKERESEAELPE